MDHPILNEMIARALGIMDEEERWDVLDEIARFLFANVAGTSLYSVNILWPLGPRVDSWQEHFDYGDRRALSSMEYAPHRQ